MTEELAWAGRIPGCGCLVAAVSGKASKEYRAEAVADMIRGGLEITQVDSNVVRLVMQLCTHEPDGAQESLFAAAVQRPPTVTERTEGTS